MCVLRIKLEGLALFFFFFSFLCQIAHPTVRGRVAHPPLPPPPGSPHSSRFFCALELVPEKITMALKKLTINGFFGECRELRFCFSIFVVTGFYSRNFSCLKTFVSRLIHKQEGNGSLIEGTNLNLPKRLRLAYALI